MLGPGLAAPGLVGPASFVSLSRPLFPSTAGLAFSKTSYFLASFSAAIALLNLPLIYFSCLTSTSFDLPFLAGLFPARASLLSSTSASASALMTSFSTFFRRSCFLRTFSSYSAFRFALSSRAPLIESSCFLTSAGVLFYRA